MIQATLCRVALLFSCGFYLSCVGARSFRVIPATPNYVLRYPDARRVPFPEILRDYNGYQPAGGWMDLRAGIELCIENAYYRPGTSQHKLEGFLGTEKATYDVRADGKLELRFVRSMQGRPSDQPPAQLLIAAEQLRTPYHRFYNEILFKRTGESRGSVLLSANTQDQIRHLAAEIVNDPDAVCHQASEHCTVFPEACSVWIEMRIVVNGQSKDVLWGIPLADVIHDAHNFQLLRVSNHRLLPIKLNIRDANAVRLPLLPGDHVTLR